MATATKKPTSQSSAYPSRRARRYQQRKAKTRHRIIAVASAVLLALAIALIVVMSSGGDGQTETTAPFDGTTIDVILGDYTIIGDLTAPAGKVRLAAVNQGGIVHNVGVRRGPISGDMRPGGSFTIELGNLSPGTYELYCDIPYHVEQGMVADLVVT